MRHALVLSTLTLALLPLLAQDAQAAGDPTAKQLKRALITTWAGKKAEKVRSGTADSVMAGESGWAFSRLPARCKTSATAGLAIDKRTWGRPAALSMITAMGHFYGETLITMAKPPRQAVPAGCARLKVKYYNGKRITVTITKVTDLPDISGAEVSAVKTTLTPSPWPHLSHPEFMLTIVRSGSLVMEAYTDSADGDVESAANPFTEAAWRRASGRLSG
ncbi:hypothetical protein [Nonomuraea sediminis]|uniref:hypothetical protein n=1 Tax=Nonomuraea sediminis TaxID=2835864 RepID=UPI001BDD8156|nr:hypothetical protein [Nonomuraea sediminis]